MANKNTQLTLSLLRDQCPLVWVTEHWNGFARIRQDLFNFGDLICVYPDKVELWQSTSYGQISVRVKKILGLDTAKQWLAHPHRKIFVIGWKKYNKPIDRKYWRPTIREITPEMFDGAG